MTLFTGKGDDGTTTTFSCDQRKSKNSEVTEALGSLDEINSYLGQVKLQANKTEKEIAEQAGVGEIMKNISAHSAKDLVHQVQETLFMIQAEVAGFPKHIDESKVRDLEDLINKIEGVLPPIKTFFISGGTELGAMFDFARTLARRAERRVVAVKEEGSVLIQPSTLAYLNRLSSFLYAMARLTNHLSGINEVSPSYE